MGKCLFMRKGETHTAPVNFNPVFANNTWEQIIEACQKNKVPDTWVVGSQKTMTINGTDYQIDIIGKNHDVYSDGSGKAPLTFQMHALYQSTFYMNDGLINSTGWGESFMRIYHLPEILALMPTEVQASIEEVKKLTSAGEYSTTINTTTDKLFLLSEIEVFGYVGSSYAGEGTQYAYYTAGNSKRKTKDGSNYAWWLRSPAQSATRYCAVSELGQLGEGNANNAFGVSFAFCF